MIGPEPPHLDRPSDRDRGLGLDYCRLPTAYCLLISHPEDTELGRAFDLVGVDG
jgi:hypothetical protein